MFETMSLETKKKKKFHFIIHLQGKKINICPNTNLRKIEQLKFLGKKTHLIMFV